MASPATAQFKDFVVATHDSNVVSARLLLPSQHGNNKFMTNPEYLSQPGRRLLDRRNFLHTAGLSTSALALTSMLHRDGLLADDVQTVSGTSPIRPDIDPSRPYAARKGHFDMPAKQVLVIYCPGAVSHVDTFDYKPALTKLHGQKPPGLPAVTFEGPSGDIAKPFWEFKPRGETGKMVSDLLPHLAQHVDDFCFFHAMSTDTSAHPQGENFMNTGFTMEGFPSFGAWTLMHWEQKTKNYRPSWPLTILADWLAAVKTTSATVSCQPLSKGRTSVHRLRQIIFIAPVL